MSLSKRTAFLGLALFATTAIGTPRAETPQGPMGPKACEVGNQLERRKWSKIGLPFSKFRRFQIDTWSFRRLRPVLGANKPLSTESTR